MTEKMTGAYKLIAGQKLCTDEEILIVETAQAVTTEGLFMDMSEVHGPQAYHCVDTLVKDSDDKDKSNEDELVAVICLKKGCTSDYCVPKCCPKDELFIDGPALCAPAKDTSHAWSHDNKLYDHQLQLIPHQRVKVE